MERAFLDSVLLAGLIVLVDDDPGVLSLEVSSRVDVLRLLILCNWVSTC